jgi:hypothetical protein
MPTFDGVIKTRTRVAINHDSFQPGMGVLGKASATEEALVHGNQKLKVDKDVTEEITGNYSLKIQKTSKTQVRGDVDVQYLGEYDLFVNGSTTMLFVGMTGQTYMSLRTERMQGAHNTHNVGPKMSVFIAPLTESHASPRQISEPAQRISLIGHELTVQADSNTIIGNSVAVVGTLQQFVGAQMQAAGISFQPIGVNLQANGAAVTLNGINTSLSIGYIKNAPAYIWTGISLGTNEWM